jgi:hypothetical protein
MLSAGTVPRGSRRRLVFLSFGLYVGVVASGVRVAGKESPSFFLSLGIGLGWVLAYWR